MSKFIDALSNAGQKSSAQIGFGPASGRDESNPQIVLIARVLPDAVVKIPKLADSDADAYSLGADLGDEKGIDGIAKALKDRVWGLRPSEKIDLASAQNLAKKGCDFVVFGSWDTEASLLNEEDLGVIGTVRVTTTEKKGRYYGVPAMDEEAVHALSELTHGLLFSPALRDLPLSVETAVDIQRILSVVDKPLIVEAPEGIGSDDIELLGNLGVAGILVDLDDMDHMDRVAGMKADIQGLPRPKARRREHSALVPSPTGQEEVHDHGVGDDDDDDDDF